ncbi:uncharacterized protein LOC134541709 [Bacillus rossius redtenbacheri]|uniref:uncharacterized protein LOC134541709 n=1 Tax=Bacillus rossius redtenbacheri TaxID=93214 RepID=UPI002FDE6E74
MQKLVLALALAAQLAGCARSPDSPGGRQEAVLAALVALHAGASCNSSRPQGARQLAVLQAAVAAVNEQPGAAIDLRVYDTCSSPEGAVKATLRALVAAEEDSGLQPPDFLGFVGPDDAAGVEAVSRVLHVLNLTHVAPRRLPRPAWPGDHTLHVAAARPDSTAQAVLTLMRQAGWTSFLAAHTGSADAARKTKALLQMAAGSDVCPSAPALQLPAEDLGQLQQGGAPPSGVVLVADCWSAAAELLARWPAALADTQVLVVPAAPELPPPRLPAPAAAAVLLLAETAAATLAPGFLRRLQEGAAAAEDVSAAPLADAVRLYAAALRDADCRRRPCLDAARWHALVAASRAPPDAVSLAEARFAADLPSRHRVYLAARGDPSWTWVTADLPPRHRVYLAARGDPSWTWVSARTLPSSCPTAGDLPPRHRVYLAARGDPSWTWVTADLPPRHRVYLAARGDPSWTWVSARTLPPSCPTAADLPSRHRVYLAARGDPSWTWVSARTLPPSCPTAADLPSRHRVYLAARGDPSWTWVSARTLPPSCPTAADLPSRHRVYLAERGDPSWTWVSARTLPPSCPTAADLPSRHRVYLAARGDPSWTWVGNMTDGGRQLRLASDWSVPAPPPGAGCAAGSQEAGDVWPGALDGHGYYEAVGMLAGAGTGLVALLVLCTWAVYRSFRVPGRPRSPPSSVSSCSRRS